MDIASSSCAPEQGLTSPEAGTFPPAPAADVAIVGAGLAGSLLALVLARSGFNVAVVDLHAAYRSDFRCERVSTAQVQQMDRLGVLDAVQAALPVGAKLTGRGFRYDEAVNAVRAAWPETVRFTTGRIVDIVDGADGEHQDLLTMTGTVATARLAVLATGPSPQLAARLGLTRQMIRRQHSLCLGFSIAPPDGAAFDFEAMIHRGERAGDKVGFISLFPQGEAMRVNLFSYHDAEDPWVRYAKQAPLAALGAIAPRLGARLAGARVVGRAEVRATDLYRTEGAARAGLVLIGDALQTACPSTALGVTRLLTDVERLAHGHLPEWLETPRMGADKIAAFYADPIRRAVDAAALRKAERSRDAALRTAPLWRMRRLFRDARQAARPSHPASGVRGGRAMQLG